MTDPRIVEALATQIGLTNKLRVAQELFKLEYIEPDEYIDKLMDINEEIEDSLSDIRR